MDAVDLLKNLSRRGRSPKDFFFFGGLGEEEEGEQKARRERNSAFIPWDNLTSSTWPK